MIKSDAPCVQGWSKPFKSPLYIFLLIAPAALFAEQPASSTPAALHVSRFLAWVFPLVLIWWWINRLGHRKGWAGLVRHLVGGCAALVGSAICLSCVTDLTLTSGERAAFEAASRTYQAQQAAQTVPEVVETPAMKAQKAWTQLAAEVFGDQLHKAEWVVLGESEEGAHSVWFKVDSSGRSGHVVGRAANQIHKFLTEAYRQKILRNPKGVVFLVMVDLVDPYGNKSVDKVLNINFDGRDLRQVNWAGIYEVLLLDLASVTPSNRVGGEILEDYCADPDHWKMTPKFCAKASKW